MSTEKIATELETLLAIAPEMLECMHKLGKFMIASGSSVGVVQNTLTRIALAYDVHCGVIALPNILMIKMGTLIVSANKFVPVTLDSSPTQAVSI